VTTPLPDPVGLVADIVAKGRCILFLGAAVHACPPDNLPYAYPASERPPLGAAFSELLAARSGFSTRLPKEPPSSYLQRVALDYEIQFGRQALIEEIRKAVDDGKKPSPVVRALAALDFPFVITTNYDPLFEQALRANGKKPALSIYKKNEGSGNEETTDNYPGQDDPSPDRPFVLKLHGDVEKPESIVITDEDYIQFVLRMSDKEAYHPVPIMFRERFVRWSTLFIGYSLMDYNLRLLFKTLRWKVDMSSAPPTYSVDRSPDPLILNVWQSQRRYINFIAQDVWAFVPDLYRRIKGEEMPL
jgi:SIR2-like domain